MAKRLTLFRSENNTGEHYVLKRPSRTLMQTIKHDAFYLLKLPVRFLKYLLGLPLSYFVIQPLFGMNEKKKSIIAQNKKNPDWAWDDDKDKAVFSVIPATPILKRLFDNWWCHIREKLQKFPILSRKFSKNLPTAQYSDSAYLKHITEEVKALINGTSPELKGRVPLKCGQIYFRGLEHLAPQIKEDFLNTLQQNHNYDFTQNRKHYNYFTLTTTRGARLDSVEVKGPAVEEMPMSQRTFIVSCLPRGNNFMYWLKQYRYMADELNTTVIGFNYRGTTPRTKGIIVNQGDMQHDAMAQVQRLLMLGAKPEQIGLVGECLGANIATRIAAELHQQGCPVKLFNARSFRSMSTMILARVRPAKHASPWTPVSWLRTVGEVLTRFIVTPFLYFVGWDLSVEKAFKSIPATSRDFLCVRSRKNNEGKRFRDDQMIPHRIASIYSLVKEEQKRIGAKLARQELLIEAESSWLADDLKKHQFYVSPAHYSNAATMDGHSTLSRELVQTHSELALDGREYTLGFFRRVWPSVSTTVAEKKLLTQ